MRTLILTLALSLVACGSGSGSSCESLVPRISNLSLTPVSATVDDSHATIYVVVQFNFSDPDDNVVVARVSIQDSSGQNVLEVRDYDIILAQDTFSLTVPISAERAEVFTINVFVKDVCRGISNSLQETFEIVEVAISRSNYQEVSGTILGSLNFDVTQIESSSLVLGLGEAQPTIDVYMMDVNGDWFIDSNFGLKLGGDFTNCYDSAAVLHGKTYSGNAFGVPIKIRSGHDSIDNR